MTCFSTSPEVQFPLETPLSAVGAYTAGRTVNGTQIFRYSQHIQRLCMLSSCECYSWKYPLVFYSLANSIIGLSPQGSYIPSLDTIRSVVTDKIQTTYDFLCDNDKSISENKHNIKFTVHFPVPINENVCYKISFLVLI